MIRTVALIVGLLLLATLSSSAQFVGGMSGVGLGVGGGGSSSGGPPPTCAGAIDLSVGCIIPGLGP